MTGDWRPGLLLLIVGVYFAWEQWRMDRMTKTRWHWFGIWPDGKEHSGKSWGMEAAQNALNGARFMTYSTTPEVVEGRAEILRTLYQEELVKFESSENYILLTDAVDQEGRRHMACHTDET